jgi:hypothetical protein
VRLVRASNSAQAGPENGKILMSEKFGQTVKLSSSCSFGVVRQIRCDSENCSRPAALRLDFRLLCLDHLVEHCHKRLETCQQEVCRNFVPAEDVLESNNTFLEECTSKLAGFLMARTELENIDRARLLDVLLWAVELDAKYACPTAKCRAAVKCAGKT